MLRVKGVTVWLVLSAGLAGIPGQNAFAGNAPCRLDVPRKTKAEFFQTADQVLAQMSRILTLPVKAPIKESVCTKAEIRTYLLREQKRTESAKERYANQKVLEAFGLIPKGFPLDSFLIGLLSNEVAGFYDPKRKEFYIADWISPPEQKPVMAHELTHALDDEYFHLENWERAAHANDDAKMARDAVVEGSALVAMMDYSFRGLHARVREMPDIAPFLEASLAAHMGQDPQLRKAPLFIRDELLFPYLQGAAFTQAVLKENSGWAGFKKVFKSPPLSTQQILHPTLYFEHVKPRSVPWAPLKSAVPRGYRKLDENVVGEFALDEILKPGIGEAAAHRLSAMWAGDRYAVFENKRSKQTLLIVLYALQDSKDTPSFFAGYRDALEKKYRTRRPVAMGRTAAAVGRAFLECYGKECLDVEGTSQEVFEGFRRHLGWPQERALPERQKKSAPGLAPRPQIQSAQHEGGKRMGAFFACLLVSEGTAQCASS